MSRIILESCFHVVVRALCVFFLHFLFSFALLPSKVYIYIFCAIKINPMAHSTICFTFKRHLILNEMAKLNETKRNRGINSQVFVSPNEIKTMRLCVVSIYLCVDRYTYSVVFFFVYFSVFWKIRWSLLAAVCFYLIGRKVCLMLTICLCNAIEIGIAPSSLLFSSASFNSLTVCRHHIYPSILVIDATRSQQEKWTNATAAAAAATTQHTTAIAIASNRNNSQVSYSLG